MPTPLRILTQSLSLEPVGGVELCTYQDSTALAERGHSVEVMFGADGVLREGYESAGAELSGPYSFGLDPRHVLRDLNAYRPAAARARRLKPDVLWLNRPEHLIWAQLVSRWARTPIVCHLHHLPNPRASQLAVGVAHFIAVSEYMRRVWTAAGIDAKRISVIHNAISPADYPVGGREEQVAARHSLGLPVDVPVVLFYGRVVEDKGVTTLLDAWRELRLSPDQALLVLVGSPPEEDPEVARALQQLPPETYRWFPGRADVVPFLHAADLVVAPSWVREAFGRVVIEAMSTGRPVIASDDGAVPEILTGEMARFLVPPRDVAALAERIRSFLTWRDDEPGLGQACTQWVERHFPYSRHVEALEQVLQAHRRA